VNTTARLFVTVVLAISVAATATLIKTIPSLYLLASTSSRATRNAIADACTAELALAAQHGPAAIAATTARLTRAYELRSLRIYSAGEAPAGAPGDLRVLRRAGDRIVETSFSGNAVAPERESVRLAAAAAGVVFVIGTALLVLALVSLVRPPDPGPPAGRRPQAGADDYLLETFGASIQRFKGRESELRHLHEVEKGRADELATLTATLVRSLTSGFIALDEHERILDMNAEARQLLGIPPNVALAGQTLAAITGETEFSGTLANAAHERIALQRHEVQGEREAVKVIGLTTVPLLDERSHYFGMLALFTDLTPIRRLESRLRDMQSLADLGEMSAGIAHEFRNSLSTIVGYLKLARRGVLSVETEERLRRAEEEAHQLAGAVESLLVFARPMELQRQNVDLVELVTATVERLEPLSAGIAFRMLGGPAAIEGDPLLLSRTIENVIRNAVDAIQEKSSGGGTVTIVTSSSPHPSLVFTDDGVGLDPGDANRLFLPFQSTKPQGFGVGLALARKIVLLHGGTIQLTGEQGTGATVTLEFPNELVPLPVRPERQG